MKDCLRSLGPNWACFTQGGSIQSQAWLVKCCRRCCCRKLKVFDWLHLPAATAWGWYLQPSAGYIGQGMIMGPKTAWSMMGGAVTGEGNVLCGLSRKSQLVPLFSHMTGCRCCPLSGLNMSTPAPADVAGRCQLLLTQAVSPCMC